MRVEVLYTPGCPHHPAAVEQLKDVLSEENLSVEIHEVAVTDAMTAKRCKFRGSPTIRINGRDIAGESQGPESFALACRVYAGAKTAGVPPTEMIRRAIREARKGEKA